MARVGWTGLREAWMARSVLGRAWCVLGVRVERLLADINAMERRDDLGRRREASEKSLLPVLSNQLFCLELGLVFARRCS
jgi:hypothetical protein